MTNADKSAHWAWIARLDRIAIPLWLAGATLSEAYRAALKTYDQNRDLQRPPGG